MEEYEVYYSFDGGTIWKYSHAFETYARALDRARLYYYDGCRSQIRMFSGRILWDSK